MKKYLFIVVLLVVAFPATIFAQKAAVKTNLLYWATTTPNLGVEFRLADRYTLNLEGGYNPFTLDDSKEVNRKLKHFLVTPEVRYWFCEAFNGHFIGINANYSQFNISAVEIPEIFYSMNETKGFTGMTKDTRNEGWAAGAGITYGYQWILGKRLNLEATLGLGYWYTDYEEFDNRKCGLFQKSFNRHLLGITKCGVSFIYLIK
jgi:hypothetical protein